MRAILAALILIASAVTATAETRDSNDRSLSIEMNRERSENRIQRLHEDRRETDKARAQSPGTNPGTPKKKRSGSSKDQD